jgi:riboflavin synthase
MFTGIVRELGRVVDVDAGEAGATLRISAPETALRTGIGDSVAIGGVCLTAESVDGETMRFHAVPETLSRSTLGGLHAGDAVNVEPALRAGEPLGGHIVQGHVDGLGSVRAVEQEGDGVRMSFDAPPELLAYLVEKGSVTVDGVSLTVAALEDGVFSVALIPHTLSVTTLGALAPGSRVNLEVDVLAKYVERLVAPRLR